MRAASSRKPAVAHQKPLLASSLLLYARYGIELEIDRRNTRRDIEAGSAFDAERLQITAVVHRNLSKKGRVAAASLPIDPVNSADRFDGHDQLAALSTSSVLRA